MFQHFFSLFFLLYTTFTHPILLAHKKSKEYINTMLFSYYVDEEVRTSHTNMFVGIKDERKKTKS